MTESKHVAWIVGSLYAVTQFATGGLKSLRCLKQTFSTGRQFGFPRQWV